MCANVCTFNAHFQAHRAALLLDATNVVRQYPEMARLGGLRGNEDGGTMYLTCDQSVCRDQGFRLGLSKETSKI